MIDACGGMERCAWRSVFVVCVALGVLWPGAIEAQDVSWDGSVWSRFEARDVDGGSESAFTVMQTRLGATGVFSPLVRMYVQAQDVRTWGDPASSSTSPNRFDVHQGYLEVGRYEDTPVWLRIGRQEYEVAFGRLLGTPVWAPGNRSYDGLRAATPLGEGSRLELFGFQITESDTQLGDVDEYLAGAWAEFDLGDARTLHLFGLHDRDNADLSTARTTLGTEYVATTGPVRYRIEAAVQAGTVNDLDVSDASLLAAFASVPFADGRGSLGVGYDRYDGNATPGAGETAGFSDLFGRNHRFLGFADIFNDPRANTAGRGLTDLDLRGTWTVRDGLVLRADWHRFSLVDASGLADGALADELDLQLMGRLVDGLDIRAGGSWVDARDTLGALGVSPGDQIFGYIQLSAGF